jgi:uncharacterized protein YgiB involved in biofilm formation
VRRQRIYLVAVLALTGCGFDETPPIQRDVYHNQADCVADWGDDKLCERRQETGQAGAGARGLMPYPYFYGPGYYGGERAVVRDDGTRIAPSTSRFASTSTFTTAKPSLVTPGVHPSSIARGGFGAAGRGVASAG